MGLRKGRKGNPNRPERPFTGEKLGPPPLSGAHRGKKRAEQLERVVAVSRGKKKQKKIPRSSRIKSRPTKKKILEKLLRNKKKKKRKKKKKEWGKLGERGLAADKLGAKRDGNEGKNNRVTTTSWRQGKRKAFVGPGVGGGDSTQEKEPSRVLSEEKKKKPNPTNLAAQVLAENVGGTESRKKKN